MNNTLAIQVHDIAEQVRDWVERLARKRGHSDDYDLNGYCAIASAELHQRLLAADVRCEMRLAASWNGSHVYVVCQDYVIDVTATQFREFKSESIVIRHEKELEAYWFYGVHSIFDNRKALRKLQIENKWPQDQLVLAR